MKVVRLAAVLKLINTRFSKPVSPQSAQGRLSLLSSTPPASREHATGCVDDPAFFIECKIPTFPSFIECGCPIWGNTSVLNSILFLLSDFKKSFCSLLKIFINFLIFSFRPLFLTHVRCFFGGIVETSVTPFNSSASVDCHRLALPEHSWNSIAEAIWPSRKTIWSGRFAGLTSFAVRSILLFLIVLFSENRTFCHANSSFLTVRCEVEFLWLNL